MVRSSISSLHIYTRVSSVAQADKGTSLDSQLELGQKKAAELGFKAQHWDEGGKSSHHEEMSGRPVLFELFNAVKAGVVKHLWVYDQSRLSRNDQVASLIRYECNKQGVTLYTKDGQYDLSNPQDKFLKQLLDAVAEFDNATRAERTRIGKLRRVQAGQWHGGPPPYGYQIVNKYLAIDKTEAKWVERIFQESSDGASPATIKLLLDSHGVAARRGNLWSIGSVAAMLTNPHYAGNYTFNDSKSGDTVRVTCPPIVSEALWSMVQVRHHQGKNRSHQVAATKHFYLLRNIMFCSHCGRHIAGRRKESKGEALYYCPNKERKWAEHGQSESPWKRGTGCGFDRSLNIDKTDELVWRLVKDTHQKSSLLKEEVKRQVLATQGLSGADKAAETKKLQARLKKLQREAQIATDALGNLESQHLLGTLMVGVYEAAKKRTQEARLRIEEEASEIRLRLETAAQRKQWVNWIDAFGTELGDTSTFNDEQRRTYIEGIVERIDVRWVQDQKEHQINIHFRLPIVEDGLKWLDSKRKSSGYELVDGTRDAVVKLPFTRKVA